MIKVPSAPLNLFLNITSKCNLNCKHCNVMPPRMSEEDLSTSEWVDLIDRLAEIKVFVLHISGGEPFMRQDLFTIIDHIARRPFRLCINTNAMLIDGASAKHLSRYQDRINYIMVSLDGSRPSTHDQLRGEGSFDRTLEGTKELLKEGFKVGLYTTVNKYNFRDLADIVQLARELGIMWVKFNDLAPAGNGLRNYQELALSLEENRMVTDEVHCLHEEFGAMVSGTFCDWAFYFSNMNEIQDSEVEAHPLSGCGATLEGCSIRPDGSVIPCDRLWDLTVGNIRHQDFKEIWLSSPGFRDFRKRFSLDLDSIPECRDCSYKGQCSGGCPATAYSLEGRLIARDPLSCYRIYKGEEVFNVR